MANLGMKPNEINYSVLLEAFCSRGSVHEEWQFLNDMKGEETAPNVRTHKELIYRYCKHGHPKEAFCIHENLIRENDLVDVSLSIVLIGALCCKQKVSEACTFLGKLENSQNPNAETYNLLISSLCKWGDFKSSLQLVDGTCEWNLFPNMVILIALLGALCRRWEMKVAAKLWHMMQDDGFVGDEFTLVSLIPWIRSGW